MAFHLPLRLRSWHSQILILPLLTVVLIAGVGAYFYVHGQQIMIEELRGRLRNTAAVAALLFSDQDVNQVWSRQDLSKPAYISLVTKLAAVRKSVPNMRLAYILRRTNNPTTLSFVADADAFLSQKELDVNHNGIVDPSEQPSYPGQPYNISDIPALKHDAFQGPSVDPTFTAGQWGEVISGYAPIRDAQGDAIAVLGINMNESDFVSLSRVLFSPVAFSLILLAGVFSAFYIIADLRRRRLQALQQLEVERTALMDLATHQLGVPLATFRWWLEILREGDVTKIAEKQDVYGQLEEGIARMDDIVRSLQAATHLSDTQAWRVFEEVSLPGVIDDVTKGTQQMLARRGQTFITEIGSVPVVHIERKLLEGVLKELIENASFYSPNNSEIAFRVRATKSFVEIEVQDHGYGIPKQDLPRIFGRFVRASNASLYKPAGNGLGLSIAKGIIERAGGSISVTSEEGKGSVFLIRLPIA